MTLIELIWTITPALILIAIAFPSFRLLYLLDEVTSPTVTIKVTGLNGLKFIINNLKIFITNIRCKLNTCLFTKSLKKNLPVKALTTHSLLNIAPNPFFLSKNMSISRSKFEKLSIKILSTNKYFHTQCRAINRIGPHNTDVISVMVGLLLGDGYLNNRSGEGARMAVKQSIVHKEYLFSIYEFFYKRGYCTSLEPRLYVRTLKGKNIKYFGYEFNTFTFRSLVWLHKLFYKNGKKVVPSNISELLTPLSLAVWFMTNSSIKENNQTNLGIISINALQIISAFNSIESNNILISVLKNHFNIKSYLTPTVTAKDKEGRYFIKIDPDSMESTFKLIKPFIFPSAYAKLGLTFPLLEYNNPEIHKSLIYKENYNKSGI